MADAAPDAAALPALSHEEIRRYSRHLILDDIGMVGQRRLKASSILCVGSGGLGSPALMYLAAAGVGTLGVVDDDVVDESNLQRQIVHSTQALGTPKVGSAAQRLEGINPHVSMQKHTVRLTPENALDIIGDKVGKPFPLAPVSAVLGRRLGHSGALPAPPAPSGCETCLQMATRNGFVINNTWTSSLNWGPWCYFRGGQLSNGDKGNYLSLIHI